MAGNDVLAWAQIGAANDPRLYPYWNVTAGLGTTTPDVGAGAGAHAGSDVATVVGTTTRDTAVGTGAERVTAATLAGESITAKLTSAPGNGAPIGGLKVTTANGWFAARPSGTEDIYKIYAESFVSPVHLQAVVDDARQMVGAALA